MIFNLFAAVFISASLMCDTLNNDIKQNNTNIDNSFNVSNNENDYFLNADQEGKNGKFTYVSKTETYELPLFTNFLNDLVNNENDVYLTLHIRSVLSSNVAIYFDKVLKENDLYNFYRNDNLQYSLDLDVMPYQFSTNENILFLVNRGNLLFTSNSAKLFTTSYWDGDYSKHEKYYLPPYITINKDARSFIYNVGFDFEGVRYYGIEYKYHEYYRFLGASNFDFNMSISTDGNDYVFTFNHLTNDNIFEMYDHIPILTLTTYGNLGFQYLNDQYVSADNNYISGTYYLRINRLLDMFLHDSKWGHGVDVVFSSNNEYFDTISIMKSNIPDGYKIGVYYINATKSIKVYDRSFNVETGETIEYLDVDMSDFNAINLDRVPYNLDLYKMLRVAYAVEEVKGYYIGDVDDYTNNGDMWGLLGNAFTSLGSIFGLMIFPGVSLGLLLSLPIFGIVLMFIIGLFKR